MLICCLPTLNKIYLLTYYRTCDVFIRRQGGMLITKETIKENWNNCSLYYHWYTKM